MTRAIPASPAQRRMWLAHLVNEGDSSQTVANVLRLSGPVDPAALRAAVRALVRRHEVLRTTYRVTGQTLLQCVQADAEVLQGDVDLAHLPVPARERALADLAAADARRPFDLGSGPVLRATPVRLGALDQALVLTVHHIAIDRWSRHVLLRDLGALYGAAVSGRPPALPELGVTYADHTRALDEAAAAGALEAPLAYWQRTLAGATPTSLSAGTARGGSRPAGYATFTLASDAVAPLRALARADGATLFMAVLAAVDVLLLRLTGATDLVVAVPSANRTWPGTQDLVGFFVNTLLVRVDLSGDPDFGEVLRRVRAAVLGAQRHAQVPYDLVVERSGLRRHDGRAPLCDVVLAFANDPDPVPEFGGLSASVTETLADAAKFDLTIALTDLGADLDGCVEYDRTLFDDADAGALVSRLEAVLAAAAAAPHRPVLDLPLTAGAGTGPPAAPLPPHEAFEFETDAAARRRAPVPPPGQGGRGA